MPKENWVKYLTELYIADMETVLNTPVIVKNEDIEIPDVQLEGIALDKTKIQMNC